MVKSLSIYTDITDLEVFEKYLFEKINLRMIQLPGVLGVNVTKIFPKNAEFAQKINGIQIIIETYFESQETIDRIVNSIEGQEIMGNISNLPSGELSFFIGTENKLLPESKDNN